MALVKIHYHDTIKFQLDLGEYMLVMVAVLTMGLLVNSNGAPPEDMELTNGENIDSLVVELEKLDNEQHLD